MTSVSLALLGSIEGEEQSKVANIKSTSTGPNNGERLTLYPPLARSRMANSEVGCPVRPMSEGVSPRVSVLHVSQAAVTTQ